PNIHVAEAVNLFPDFLDKFVVTRDGRQFLEFVRPDEASTRLDPAGGVSVHAGQALASGDASWLIAWRGGQRAAVGAGGVNALLVSDVGEHSQIFDAGVVLHDRARIQNVAAIFSDLADDTRAKSPHLVGISVTEQDIRDAPAEGKLIVQLPMGFE